MELTGKAFFVRRPRILSDLLGPHPVKAAQPYRIVATVTLAGIDYENFITDMLVDRQFIEDHASLCGTGSVWSCILVRQRGKNDGVLVIPEDLCFVGWAAYYSFKK